MFNQFNTPALRWALDVLGFLALLIACYLHSWTWDAVGVGLLFLATIMGPPANGLGARIKAAIGAALLTLAPPIATPGRLAGDLRDSAYVQHILREMDMQLSFDFTPTEFAPCTYSVTPCARPTTVRAWGDLH